MEESTAAVPRPQTWPQAFLLGAYRSIVQGGEITPSLLNEAVDLLREHGAGTQPEPAAKKPPTGPPKKKPMRAERTVRLGVRGLMVADLAAETGWSESTLRRIFSNEPGVLVIEHPETLHRRGYTSLRIPRDVADRVIRRHARK